MVAYIFLRFPSIRFNLIILFITKYYAFELLVYLEKYCFMHFGTSSTCNYPTTVVICSGSDNCDRLYLLLYCIAFKLAVHL